jgi:hypothetical protein
MAMTLLLTAAVGFGCLLGVAVMSLLSMASQADGESE